MTVANLTRFDGGLNLRDSLELLAPNETPDAVNMTLTTRGSAWVRNGCANAIALPGNSGAVAFIHYSAALDQFLCVRQDTGVPQNMNLFSRPGDLSGSWTSRGIVGAYSGQATGQGAAFIDFPGNPPKVVLVTPVLSGGGVGGVFTWDGTTLTNVSTTVRGSTIALWHDRAWVGCYPSSDANGNPTSLFFSAIGDPATWSTTLQANQLREKDASQITAIGVIGGGLLAFKKRSAYRISDSNTGAYTTIDNAVGCIGPRAVVGLKGRLYSWAADGLYEFDGIGPGRNVGDKARPLFATDAAIAGGTPFIAGGRLEDRVLFAYPSSQGGNNDRLLEYSPDHGWLMKHELAAAGQNEVSSFTSKENTLYAAVTDGDDLFKMFTETPGADDGTNFTSNIKIAPINRGRLHRLQRVRVYGKAASAGTNTKELRTYLDWSTAVRDTFDITTAIETADAQEAIDLQGLGHAEAFQLEFRCSGGTGAAELDRLVLDLIPLKR